MTTHGLAARPLPGAAALTRAVAVPGGLWREVRVVEETGSTNSDLVADAIRGAEAGAVLVAEAQSAGRGRMGRQWVNPPRTALTFSVLLRPAGVSPASRSWVPLLAGVAIAAAIGAQAAVETRLKWPNDVLVDDAKLGGILAEQAGDAIVVGAGINVSTACEQLPVAGATSLALAGAADTDRGRLLVSVLRELEHWYVAWAAVRGDAAACGLRQEYLRRCATIGRQVRVSMPGGSVVTGTASGVDPVGRLVVRSPSGHVSVSAGDVVHVR